MKTERVRVVDEYGDLCIVEVDGRYEVRWWDTDFEADDPIASRTPSSYGPGTSWATSAEAFAYACGYETGASENK